MNMNMNMTKENKLCQELTCGRSLYDDKHCIFHSEDKNKGKEFIKAFWVEYERQEKTEDPFNFRGFVFPGVFDFMEKEFKKGVSFILSKFLGNANFSRVIFLGNALFSNATFSGGDFFRYTKFKGLAFFDSVTFLGDAVFDSATFSGVASFHSAIFSGKTSFWFATFSKETSFDSTTFSGEASFDSATFLGKTTFRSATFSGDTMFNNANFSSNADFNDTKIQDVSKLKMLDTYFYNVSGLFEFIEKNDKVFKKLRKRSLTLKTEFLPENLKLILGEGVTTRYPVQSRQIKDDMYLLDKKERISKMSGIRKFLDKKLYFFWWLFADYGRSFLRWAGWSLFFAFLFGLLYTLCFQLEQTSEAFLGQPPGLWSSLYFSIVTFTTLGFGDIVPANIAARILVTIEVILGYIMMGGLISIFANKLARRS
jgi:hypothetical protein